MRFPAIDLIVVIYVLMSLHISSLFTFVGNSGIFNFFKYDSLEAVNEDSS